MDYEIGSRIGDYEVLSVLGAGGMGRVYKVRNLISDRIEAMKVLLPNLVEQTELGERFLREIKVQAKLSHPNIAALYTASRIDNQLVMLLEYVEGISVDQMLKSGPLPVDKAVAYMVQALDALDYGHKQGVIHRDLKPANMMVTSDGVLKILDFGIARLAADQALTKTGITVGSLFYMSPEQIKGEGHLDARSDLYSLGISLYEMVTGRRPFLGDSEYSIMAAHLNEVPPPPVELDPRIPPGLSEIILISIAKDLDKRFQSAQAFRNALQSFAGNAPRAAAPQQAQAVPTKPLPAPPPLSGRASSHRGLWITLGAMVSIGVVVLAITVGPRFFGSRAESTPASTPAANPSPVQTPQQPASEPQSQPPQATPTDQPVQATPDVPQPNAPAQQPAAAKVTRPLTAPATHAGGGASSAAQQPPSSPAYQQPAAQQQSPQTPAVDTAALNELNDLFQKLAIRANTIRSKMTSLHREQQAMGVGMRGDMESAAKRMENYLDQTEAALKQNDLAGAKRQFANAEREVEKLEKFLGL